MNFTQQKKVIGGAWVNKSGRSNVMAFVQSVESDGWHGEYFATPYLIAPSLAFREWLDKYREELPAECVKGVPKRACVEVADDLVEKLLVGQSVKWPTRSREWSEEKDLRQMKVAGLPALVRNEDDILRVLESTSGEPVAVKDMYLEVFEDYARQDMGLSGELRFSQEEKNHPLLVEGKEKMIGTYASRDMQERAKARLGWKKIGIVMPYRLEVR